VDARFAENAGRVANVVALDAELSALIGRFDRADLIALLEAADAVVAPVNSVADIMADPHIAARDSIISVEDDELGRPMRMQAPSGRFSRTPPQIHHAGPPAGAHNREILMARLGFTEDELTAAGITP
jgi:crotonobetainyl-CoA:carnitine CoA-transferase CaiB-like acyl-CoA transferase